MTALVLAGALLLALTGCSLGDNSDELFVLPKPPLHLEGLQKEIDKLYAAASVSAISPSSGKNRQNIQLVDLDGDGADEAVTFLYVADELPLHILVFRSEQDSYRLWHTLKLPGDTLNSIDYVDLDGDRIKEVVAGYQLAGDTPIKSLQVLQLEGDDLLPVLSAEYTVAITAAMTGNVAQLLTVVSDPKTKQWQLQLYGWQEGLLQVQSTAPLSKDALTLRRARITKLRDGTMAVCIMSSVDAANVLTDVFIVNDGSLLNLSRSMASANSDETLRPSYLLSCDINNDGVVDLPKLMTAYDYAARADSSHTILNWQDYDKTGNLTLMSTTYHNYTDDWYLKLPQSWVDKVRVKRSDASLREKKIVLGLPAPDGGRVYDVLAVLTLSGSARNKAIEGKVNILTKNDVTVAVVMYPLPDELKAYQLNETVVRELLHWVNHEWAADEIIL